MTQGFVDGIVANWFIPYYWSRFGAWSTTYRYSGGSGSSSSMLQQHAPSNTA